MGWRGSVPSRRSGRPSVANRDGEKRSGRHYEQPTDAEPDYEADLCRLTLATTITDVDVLLRIKRLAVARHVQFTLKAEEERLRDGLSVEDVLESILNANAIKKVLRSSSQSRTAARERLYVIESPNFSGLWVYTKGTIRREAGREVFYVLVSSKLAE